MIRKILFLSNCMILLILLSSCGAGTSLQPTVDSGQMYTQVAATVQAGIALTQSAMPTATATFTMTITTTPTITATATSSTQQPTLTAYVPGSSAGTSTADNITWIADITIPDGTVVTPSDGLHKIWKVQNSGTTTWTTSYKLVWIDITNFNYNDINSVVPVKEVKIPKEVKPGEQIEITIDLVAPSKNGIYKIFFRMLNPSGQFFGDAGWVLITVGTPPAATPTLTPTP